MTGCVDGIHQRIVLVKRLTVILQFVLDMMVFVDLNLFEFSKSEDLLTCLRNLITS